MNPKSPIIKRMPSLLILAGVSLPIALFLLPKLMPTVGHHGRFVAHTLASRWSISNLIETYSGAWARVQQKADELRHAYEENEKLQLENAHLKLTLEALRFDNLVQKGEKSTEKYEMKLSEETGAKVGRTLAGIKYKLPLQLLPSQLYSLGEAYLQANEDEKAAVIFTSLTGLEENEVYRTAKNFLITGIAWYRIDNFVLANAYFDEVLKAPERPDTIQYQAQARLWNALVARRLHKEIKTQFWLKELVDHHPHSIEARWVNTREVQNATASEL